MATASFFMTNNDIIARIRPNAGKLPFLVLRVRSSCKSERSLGFFECILDNNMGRSIESVVVGKAMKFAPILKKNAIIHIKNAVARERKHWRKGLNFFLKFRSTTEITLLQEHDSYSYIVAPINDDTVWTTLNSALWHAKYINRQNVTANEETSSAQSSGKPSEKSRDKVTLSMIEGDESKRSNNVDPDLRTLVADGSFSNNNTAESSRSRPTKRTTVMKEEPEAKRATGQSSYEHFDRANSTEESITRSYVMMIAMDMLPLSIGDSFGFQQFLRNIAPNYTLPNETSIRNRLHELYDSVKSHIIPFIEKYPSVSLTIDQWSFQNAASFVTVTLHAIDDAWDAVSYTLDTFQVSEERTADNLREHLVRVVSEWTLTDKVVAIVHNNASDIVAALNSTKQLANSVFCPVNSLKCVLNSALKDKEFTDTFTTVRAIVGHFQHSRLASEALKGVQRRLKLPENRLISHCKTEFNSPFAMIERLIEQRDAINRVLSDREHTTETISNALSLTPNHWTFLKDLVEILRHFQNFTTIVSAKQRSTISVIRPLIQRLLNKIVIKNDSAIMVHVKSIVKQQLLAKFFANDSVDVFSLAAILDPRYKNLLYESKDYRQAIKTRLGEMMYEENHRAATAASSAANDERVAAIDYFFDEEIAPSQRLEIRVNFADSEESTELEYYLQEPILSPRADPLLWWSLYHKKFPTIAKIAKRFLAIPASSISSAHVSSTAENIISAKRSCLSPEDVDILVFLHQNRSTVEYIRTRD